MNKKGFTLVELTISVALISIIMVFLLNFLGQIRKDEDTISETTENILNKSLISKTINEDIRDGEGINYINCTNTSCEITLNNNITKELIIENKKLTYRDVTNNNIILTKKLKNQYNIILEQEDGLTLIKLNNIEKEYNIDITDYQRY